MTCPFCPHPLDDHDASGLCLGCAKLGGRCPGAPRSTITFSVESCYGTPAATVIVYIAGNPDLVALSMPAVTTAQYAAKRAAETMGLDPDARDWFLYDPVLHVPLAEGEPIASYGGRVLCLAWTEETNR